ncbi:MAG TPA: 3-dehydroquinate synthase family protein [Candidatus Baltobacteraceae bacterium]|nr:3-dehydroquinate synthase family protein [Candidatus Baltobacteraceae bacterium]
MVAQEEDSHLTLQSVVLNHDLEYPIAIGERLHVEAARFAAAHGSKVVVVHDVNPAVAAIARRYARAIGRDRVFGVAGFELGESRKRLATVEGVLERLVRLGADRSTLIVGVGGGVASDLFGFAAATYMRGVPYAHVATSLVAMVDAAIGGKTGVDLPAGKNLAGAFSDPVAAFCEVSALYTLSMRSVREGLAEIVKAAIIEGEDLFDGLETLSAHRFIQWPWSDLIAAAVKVKTAIVADDRLEAGMREVLNLGHSFAHGIERASDYRVTHGAAVALGLRAAGLLALRTGRFSEREHLRVLTLLTLFGMPVRTSVDTGAIFDAMLSDKKRRDGRLRFVLPRAIGDVEYGVECSDRTVRSVLGRLAQVPGTIKER